METEFASFTNNEFSSNAKRKKACDPFKGLSREEIIVQLSDARFHADKGMVLDAHCASGNVREKYGIKD